MKKETVTRRLGRGGKHRGIVSKSFISGSSKNPGELKAVFKKLTKNVGNTVESDIAQLEDWPREILSELICLHKKEIKKKQEKKEKKKKNTPRDAEQETLQEFVSRWLKEQGREYHRKGPELEPEYRAANNLLRAYGAELEPEYRAANILLRADNLRQAIASGDTGNAVRIALRLMQEYDQLILSYREYPFCVGEAQLRGARTNPVKYSESDKAKWLNLAGELIDRYGKRPSNRCLAKKISEDTKARVESVRKHLNIHLPNPRKK